MKPGELVVARMSGGITIVKLLSVEASRAKVSLRRNKEARLPVDRILIETGVVVTEDDAAEEFRQESDTLASDIDMTELWEVYREEAEAVSLDDLAELYWGAEPEATQKVALLIHLEGNNLHFISDKKGFLPRTEEAVQEILARRKRDAENSRDAQELVAHLSQSKLPDEITPHQRTLLEHIRGFAIHGDNYTRDAIVKTLLEDMEGARGDLQRLSFDLLVRVGTFSPDEPLELERGNIVEAFTDEALEEAAHIDPASVLQDQNRQDLTGLPTVTIDDAGTEDKDDALSLEEVISEDGTTLYHIGIHITDAGALIPQGSVLDQEADRRMVTLYMPERKVPMLPLDVSNAKGSLEPGETRAALSLMLRISESGEIVDWETVPSIIRSDAALSYEESDAAIATPEHPWHNMLSSMHPVSKAIRERREQAGAINFDRPEMLIKASPDGDVSIKIVPRSTPARQMVTEFMVLCNTMLAEFCRREEIPASYRSQTPPDFSDLYADLPPGTEVVDGPLKSYLMIRRMAPADIGTNPAPHGGLGVSAYIQATSPLRRYPDLVMQRQISQFLKTGQPLYSTEEMTSVAGRADVQLREISRIEEDRKRYWFLKSLRDRIADENAEADFMEAIVLENQQGRSAQLELVDFPYRIRVQLPNSVNPGETVTLQLYGVDLWRRMGHFVHVP